MLSASFLKKERKERRKITRLFWCRDREKKRKEIVRKTRENEE